MAAADHFREAAGLLDRWETPWAAYEDTIAVAVAEEESCAPMELELEYDSTPRELLSATCRAVGITVLGVGLVVANPPLIMLGSMLTGLPSAL